MTSARRARKKFSASQHHAMNELNITPLLDLAFVLLIIFIITTTPAMHDLKLNLPAADTPPQPIPKGLNTVSVDDKGKYYFNGRHYAKLNPDLFLALVAARNADTNMIVVVQGDMSIQYQKIIDLLGILSSANITKVGLMTEQKK